MTETAFTVTYTCENCGNEWDEQYPARTVVRDSDRVHAFEKDCNTLGTKGCDCCQTIQCPTCELTQSVTVDDRAPVEGGESDD